MIIKDLYKMSNKLSFMLVKEKEVLGIINTRDIKKPAALDISEKQ